MGMKRMASVLLCILLGAVLLCFSAVEAAADAVVLAYSQDPLDGGQPTWYFYYADGKLAQKKLENGDTIDYSYRLDGTLEKQTTTRADGTDTRKTVVEFDEKENPLAEYTLSEGVREDVWCYHNTYDGQGRLLTQLKTPMNLEPISESRTYTYWEDGSWELEYHDYYVYNGQMLPHCQQVRTYTKEGLLAMVQETLCDMQACDYLDTYEYDTHQNLTRTISTRRQPESGYQICQKEYKNHYTTGGQLIRRELRQSLTEGTGETTYSGQTISYEYDANGRVTSRVTRDWDGNVLTETWEYDGWGNLTRFCGMAEVPDGMGKTGSEPVEQIYAYLPLDQVLVGE